MVRFLVCVLPLFALLPLAQVFALVKAEATATATTREQQHKQEDEEVVGRGWERDEELHARQRWRADDGQVPEPRAHQSHPTPRREAAATQRQAYIQGHTHTTHTTAITTTITTTHNARSNQHGNADEGGTKQRHADRVAHTWSQQLIE